MQQSYWGFVRWVDGSTEGCQLQLHPHPGTDSEVGVKRDLGW